MIIRRVIYYIYNFNEKPQLSGLPLDPDYGGSSFLLYFSPSMETLNDVVQILVTVNGLLLVNCV
jgi:hypothetical protein